MKKKILIGNEIFSVSNSIFKDFVLYNSRYCFSYDLDRLIEDIRKKYKPIVILDFVK